jgi:hypothetical protein
MSTPKVQKLSDKNFAITDINPINTLKHFALIQKDKSGYRVAAILPKTTKHFDFTTLGISQAANEPIWIVAVGKQNQLSKYQVIE